MPIINLTIDFWRPHTRRFARATLRNSSDFSHRIALVGMGGLQWVSIITSSRITRDPGNQRRSVCLTRLGRADWLLP